MLDEPVGPVDTRDWIEWLVDAEEEYHARVVLIEGRDGKAQAYLFPLPKEH